MYYGEKVETNLINQEWSLTYRNKLPVLLNNYSLDEFVFYFLKPIHRNSVIPLQNRQKYSFPNTPKIMVLTNSNLASTQDWNWAVLGQKPPYDFQRLLKFHMQENSMSLFSIKLITAAEILSKKYGYFYLTPKMINASKGPTLLIWVHQNIFKNHPQYPIMGADSHLCEDLMIRRIIKIIYEQYKDENLKKIIHHKKCINFEKCKEMLKEKKEKVEEKPQTTDRKRKVPSFLELKKKQKCEEKRKLKTQPVPLCHQKEESISSDQRVYKPHEIKSPFKSLSSSFQIKKYHTFHNIISPRAQSASYDQQVIRDSGNLSTASQWFSRNGSGKRKMIQINNSFEVQKRRLLSTFGSSAKDITLSPRKTTQDSGKFKIKASKIIEEKLEEAQFQSPIAGSPRGMSSKQNQSMSNGDELQKQFSRLFKSRIVEEGEIEVEMETELNRILFD